MATPARADATRDSRGMGDARLWAAWLLGPLAWTLQENLSFGATEWLCSTQHHWILALFSLGTLLMAAAGAWLARGPRLAASAQAPGRPGVQTHSDARQPRRDFLARVGLALCLLCFAGIAATSLPSLLLDPCAGAT